MLNSIARNLGRKSHVSSISSLSSTSFMTSSYRSLSSLSSSLSLSCFSSTSSSSSISNSKLSQFGNLTQFRTHWYGPGPGKSAWQKHGQGVAPGVARCGGPIHDNVDLFPHPEVTSDGMLPYEGETPRNVMVLKRLEALGEKKNIPKVFLEEQGGVKSMTYDYSTPAMAFPAHAGGNEGIDENMVDIFRTQNTLKEPSFLGICTPRGFIGCFFFWFLWMWIWNVMDFGREVAVLVW